MIKSADRCNSMKTKRRMCSRQLSYVSLTVSSSSPHHFILNGTMINQEYGQCRRRNLCEIYISWIGPAMSYQDIQYQIYGHVVHTKFAANISRPRFPSSEAKNCARRSESFMRTPQAPSGRRKLAIFDSEVLWFGSSRSPEIVRCFKICEEILSYL